MLRIKKEMHPDIKYLHAFNLIPGVGPVTLRALKNHFESYATAWIASEAALHQTEIAVGPLRAILWKRPSLNPDREMERLSKEGVWLMTEEDLGYPSLLKEIIPAPVLLYGRGTPKALTGKLLIAMVGARKPTSYGLEACEMLTRDLASCGVTIVSGLALGIDTRAHETALHEKAPTVAVLGSGIDPASLYPRENRRLVERIAESEGAVISEYAPGTPALKEHFPQRNRIVAGISQGVVIVEARERSGTQIIARLALEQGREVFAVPGSIFSSSSAGPLALIKEGAKCVTQASDILEEFGIEYTKEKVAGDVSEVEGKLLALLEEPRSVDFLKMLSGLETAALMTSLSLLELKGKIKAIDNGSYLKVS